MTRAEFAGHVKEYIKWAGFGEQDDLIDWANKRPEPGELSVFWRRIADVATNGFDPELSGNMVQIASGYLCGKRGCNILHQDMSSAVIASEQSQEAAKRSRPFVGSHKLPVDLDWD